MTLTANLARRIVRSLITRRIRAMLSCTLPATKSRLNTLYNRTRRRRRRSNYRSAGRGGTISNGQDSLRRGLQKGRIVGQKRVDTYLIDRRRSYTRQASRVAPPTSSVSNIDLGPPNERV